MLTESRMHSMRFHDIVHTLESYGYRPVPAGVGVILGVPNPDVIVDTLRLTQSFVSVTTGHYNTLTFPNWQRIVVDGDFDGVYLYELES